MAQTQNDLLIAAELPKRIYSDQGTLTAGHIPVATGVGLKTEARSLTTGDLSDEVVTGASIDAAGLITLAKNGTNPDDTIQVPTAVDSLSFNATTGEMTIGYTNGVADSTITVASNEVTDTVFRIKDNGDSTKKIAFEAGNITTATTRLITMPNVDVNLGDDYINASYSVAGGYLSLHRRKGPPSTDILLNPNITIIYGNTTIVGGTTYAIGNPLHIIGDVGTGLNISPLVANITLTLSSVSKPIKIYVGNYKGTITFAGGFVQSAQSGITIASFYPTPGSVLEFLPGDNSEFVGPEWVLFEQQNGLYEAADFKLIKNNDQDSYVAFNLNRITGNNTITMPNAHVDLGQMMNTVTAISGSYLVQPQGSTLDPSQRFHFVCYGSISIDVSNVRGVMWLTNVTASTIGVSLNNPAGAIYDDAGTVITAVWLVAGESAFLTQTGLDFYLHRSASTNSSIHRVYDSTNPSKRMSWDVSGIASSTTRTVTMPDANVNLGAIPAIHSANSNSVTGTNASVVAGLTNTASAQYSSVLGGTLNVASGKYSVILNGNSNTASGHDQTILNGRNITGIKTTGAIIHGGLVEGTGGDANGTTVVNYTHRGRANINTTTWITSTGSTNNLAGLTVADQEAQLIKSTLSVTSNPEVVNACGIHEITFMLQSSSGSPKTMLAGQRRALVYYDGTTRTLDTVQTVGTDHTVGSIACTFTVELYNEYIVFKIVNTDSIYIMANMSVKSTYNNYL